MYFPTCSFNNDLFNCEENMQEKIKKKAKEAREQDSVMKEGFARIRN